MNSVRTGQTCAPSALNKINREADSLSGSSMAVIQAEDDDDELFGDFKFVSSSNLNQNNRENDDDWGDFMDNLSQKQDFFGNSLQFQISNGFLATPNPINPSETLQNIDHLPVFSDPLTNPPESQPSHIESDDNSSSHAVGKNWEKPRGALPLSIFGDEEEESDSVNPSFDDALDWNTFSSKPASTVKNGLNFGSESGIKDLIVNLYSQSEQIKTVSESNSNLVDGSGDFDEDGWEFKDALSETRGRDSDNRVKKDEEDSDLSGIKVESTTTTTTATTNPIGTLVDDGIIWESSERHQITTGFSKSGQHGGDWFVTSDDFSLNPTKIDNGFDFESGVTTPNGGNSDLLSQVMETETENGLPTYLVGENIGSDENFSNFKDAFSETQTVNFYPEGEQLEVGDQSGVEMKVPTINGGIQGNGKWSENHQGELPLSMFSNGKLDSDDSLFGEDLFSSTPTTSVTNGINSQVFSSKVSLNDLISNLYSRTEKIPTVGSTQQHIENGFDSAKTGLDSDLLIEEDDFDESSWEFKDAFSEARAEDQNSVIGDIRQEVPLESKLKSFVDLYSRLKEESFLIAHYHLDGLKKAQNVAALSGEDAKAMALHEEIQEAHEKLHQESVVSKAVNSEEHPPRNICVNELLEVMKEPKFQVLESEYHLSKRISLAEKDLNSAIGLFQHAIAMVKILTLGSLEDQSNYTTTWSKMISACAQELKHGASIWKQSLQKNVHKQLLSKSQGQRYIVSLGEIYRVVEVLRASATLYKPWILSSLVEPVHVFSLLEECYAVWSGSGLEEALWSISDTVGFGYEGTVKALLESIKFVHDLDMFSLQSHVFALKDPVCRLSVLSLRMLPDMKTVVWNGEHYFLTLANLWANFISCDPPKLPHIHVGL